MHIRIQIQWNFSTTNTLRLDSFGHFLLQYRGFPLSEVKISVTLLRPTYHGGFYIMYVLNSEDLLREISNTVTQLIIMYIATVTVGNV